MSNTSVSFKIGADNTEALNALKELKNEFKSLRDSLKNAATDLKIKVQVDTASIGNDIASIKNQIKSQIGQLQVDVKINADTSSVTSSAGSIKSQLQAALGTVDIALNLSANMASIQSDITTIKNTIRSGIGNIEANVKVKADTSDITSSATTIKNQLTTALGTVEVPLKIQADISSITGDITTIKNTIRSGIGDIEIPIKFNRTTLNADLLLIRNRINAYFATGVAVRIVPTITTADVTAARVRLRGLTSTTYQARLGINLTYLNSQIALARTMLNTLGSGVNINIDATASSLINALNELRDEVKRLRTAMSGSGGGGSGGGAGGNTGVLASLRANIAGLMAAATGGVFAAITVGTANYVRELERASQLTNVTTQEMQELAYGASTVGISMEKLSDIYKDVNDKVGDYLITGGGEMADFFEKIAPKVGVTAEQFYNLSGPDALQLYVDSLQKANVSQAEMVFYMESIANDASVLLPLLKDGGAEFQRLAEQAQKLGIILDDVSIAKAKEFQKAFGQVKETVAGLTRTLGIELAPALTDISNKFVEFAVNNADEIRDAINQIAGVFNDILSITDTVFTEIGKLWTNLTGAIEDGTGVQVTAMSWLVNTIKVVRVAFIGLRTGIELVMATIKYLVQTAVMAIVDTFLFLKGEVGNALIYIGGRIDMLTTSIETAMEMARRFFAGDFASVGAAWDANAAKIQKIIENTQAAMDKNSAEINAKRSAAQSSVESPDVAGIAQKGKDDINSVLLGSVNTKTPPPPKSTKGFTGGGYVAPPAKTAGSKGATSADRAAEEAKREDEAIARAKYEHEQALLKAKIENNQIAYDTFKRSAHEYFENRLSLNQQLYENEITELKRRRDAAEKQSERQQLETAIYVAEQEFKISQEKIERQLEKEADQTLKAKQDLQLRLDQSESKFLKVRTIEIQRAYDEAFKDIEQRFAGTLDAMQEKAKQEQIDLIVKIKEADTAKAKAEDIERQTQKILNDQSFFDRYADIQAGMNPMLRPKIEEQQKQNRRDTADKLDVQLKDLMQYQHIEGVNEQIQQLTLSIEELRIASQSPLEQFKIDLQDTAFSAAESGLSNLFMDLVDGSKSAKEALKDFARSFIQSLAQVAAQALSTYLVLSMLDAIYPGLGKATAATMSVSTSAIQNHDGGVVGIDGTDRQLNNPSDIKSNEVLTVLEKGEEVLTADDPRHRNNLDVDAYIARLIPRYHTGGIAGFAPDSEFMRTVENIEVQSQANRNVNLGGGQQANHTGGSGQPNTFNVNTFIGDEFMARAMETPAGEKAFLNLVERNATKVTVILDDN